VKTQKKKEKSINRFRSIEDSYNEQSSVKTKARKRNRTISDNDEPNERNTKFIKAVETIIGGKTDESVVIIVIIVIVIVIPMIVTKITLL